MTKRGQQAISGQIFRPQGTRYLLKQNRAFMKVSRGLKTYNFKRQMTEFWISYSNANAFVFTDNAGTVTPASFFNAAVAYGQGPAGNTAAVSIAFKYTLENVLNHSEFTVLFDSYRFNGIGIKVENMSPTALQNGLGPNAIPQIQSVLDHDDATPMATHLVAGQFENCKTKRLGQTQVLSRFTRPKLAQVAFKQSGTGLGYTHQAGKNPWIDCDYIDVEHYGHKLFISNVQELGNYCALRITTWAYLSFKTPR
jgi:hypothetical protein